MNLQDSKVRDAKFWIAEHLDQGVTCPCCGQLAREYKRKLNAEMSRFLIFLFRKGGRNWVDIHGFKTRGGDYAKVTYWGLAEIKRNTDNTKRTSAIWRLTDTGIDFVIHGLSVPSHAYIYNNEVVRFSGVPITIDESLGEKFDYHKLMGITQPDERQVCLI